MGGPPADFSNVFKAKGVEPMAGKRRPSNFKRTDLARAVLAIQDAGGRVESMTVGKDGVRSEIEEQRGEAASQDQPQNP
jgi:hypothetical protein